MPTRHCYIREYLYNSNGQPGTPDAFGFDLVDNVLLFP